MNDSVPKLLVFFWPTLRIGIFNSKVFEEGCWGRISTAPSLIELESAAQWKRTCLVIQGLWGSISHLGTNRDVSENQFRRSIQTMCYWVKHFRYGVSELEWILEKKTGDNKRYQKIELLGRLKGVIPSIFPQRARALDSLGDGLLFTVTKTVKHISRSEPLFALCLKNDFCWYRRHLQNLIWLLTSRHNYYGRA